MPTTTRRPAPTKRTQRPKKHTAARARTDPQRNIGLEKFIAMAGTAHSDYTDVSTDKYKHLADAYADAR